MMTEFIKRSEVKCDWAYTVQQQAPAGNWVDIMRCNDQALALAQAAYHQERGETMRIVEENV